MEKKKQPRHSSFSEPVDDSDDDSDEIDDSDDNDDTVDADELNPDIRRVEPDIETADGKTADLPAKTGRNDDTASVIRP